MLTFGIISFLLIFAASLLGISALQRYYEARRKKQVEGMLEAVTGRRDIPDASIFIEPQRDEHAGLASALASLDIARELETKARQGGLRWSGASVLVLMAAGAVAGLFLGRFVRVLIFWQLSSFALAILLGVSPYLYILWKRRRRLAEFESQFPEALDFLARSMRAGHALFISLEMLGQESPEPLGSEFRTVFQEQNLGAPLENALVDLARRVPLLDVRFFVSCVLLQRQTGGNLSEVLTRLAQVIRDRFRLKGQVKAASAHGRLTATILSVLPLVTTLALMLVAPAYLPSMAGDPDGKYMILGSILLQGIGYFWMRRVINIKV